jgi:hypothetical protein
MVKNGKGEKIPGFLTYYQFGRIDLISGDENLLAKTGNLGKLKI